MKIKVANDLTLLHIFLDYDCVLTTITIQLLYSFFYLLHKLMKSLALEEVHLII